MAIIERFYPLSWGRIAALEYANKAHTSPLMAFHGWLDNAASFLPLMRALPNYNWQSFDLAGHGHSDPRPEGSMRHFLSYIQDIWEVMGQQQANQFNLMGHSLGSGIATMLAATWPERVGKLVLIDGMGPFSIAPNQWLPNYADSFADLHDYNRGKVSASRCFEQLDDATEYLMKRRRWPLEKSSAALLAARQLSDVDGKLTWNYDPQLKLKSPLPFTHAQVNEVYAQITAPVLLLRFSDGPMFMDMIPWQERIDVLDNLHIVDLDGGHHMHMDKAEKIAEVVRDFLA